MCGSSYSLCNIDSKYLPGKVDVYSGERHDFLKAIWEDGIVQDYHIIIKDCKIEKFNPSSKKFNMPKEEYLRLKKLHNHIN